LFTHGVDGACVQGEFLAAPGRQPIEIKTGRPAFVPFQRLLLSLVAEIPDKVAGARLAVEHSDQRFDTVSIDQQHSPKLVRLSRVRKVSKLSKTLNFGYDAAAGLSTPILLGGKP
jgi:hypothetical protein